MKYFKDLNKTLLLYFITTFPLVFFCLTDIVVGITHSSGYWHERMYLETIVVIVYLFLILIVNWLKKGSPLSKALQLFLMWIVIYSQMNIIILRRASLIYEFKHINEYDCFNVIFYQTIVLLLTLIITFQFLPISLIAILKNKLTKYIFFTRIICLQGTSKTVTSFYILPIMFVMTSFLYITAWGIIKIMDPTVSLQISPNMALVADLNQNNSSKARVSVKTISTQSIESNYKFVFKIGENEFEGAQNLEIQFPMEEVLQQLIKNKYSGIEILAIKNLLNTPSATVELSKDQPKHTFDWNRDILIALLRQGEVVVKNSDSNSLIKQIFLDYYDYECDPIAGFRADENLYFAIDRMPKENTRPPCFY